MSLLKFKVGDKVKSAPTSSDVRIMKAVWIAEIYEVRSANDRGGCYETLGHWEPIKDADGNVDEFWAEKSLEELNEDGLRQLNADNLVEG